MLRGVGDLDSKRKLNYYSTMEKRKIYLESSSCEVPPSITMPCYQSKLNYTNPIQSRKNVKCSTIFRNEAMGHHTKGGTIF